jgi:hypothetical protein
MMNRDEPGRITVSYSDSPDRDNRAVDRLGLTLVTAKLSGQVTVNRGNQMTHLLRRLRRPANQDCLGQLTGHLTHGLSSLVK